MSEGIASPRARMTTLTATATGWPFGKGWILFPMGAILGITLLVARPRGGQYAVWLDSSARIHESLIGAGPIVALWAAVVGASVGGKSFLFAALARRRRGRQFIAHCLTLAAWSAVAYACGLAPLMLWTVSTSNWGRPFLGDAIIALAGIVLFTVVGFALGALLPDLRWVVLVPVAALIYLILPQQASRAFSVISPVQAWLETARFQPNGAVALYFVIFALAALTCALTSFADAPMASGHTGRIQLPTLAAAGALLVLVAIPFVWRPDLYVVGDRPQGLCRSSGPAAVCVHPAHSKSLPMVVNAVGAFQRAGAGAFINSVTDLDISEVYTGPPGQIIVDVAPTTTPSALRLSLATGALGSQVCDVKFPQKDETNSLPADLGSAITSRVLRTAGDAAGAQQVASTVIAQGNLQKIDRLSDAAFRNLLTMRRTKIQQCSLALTDLK